MIPYIPVLSQPRSRLGQLSAITGGISDAIAKKIVTEAEPVTRRVIRDERNRLAEALMGGIPFFAISAIAFVGTHYLVSEDAPTAKFIGYGSAAASAGGGALWTFSRITETPPPEPPSTAPPEVVAVAVQTAQAIVNDAEPKIREIIQEERVKIADAATAGIPFWAGSGVAIAATAVLVDDEEKLVKMLGYSASALLAALGAYVALNKERG